MARVFFMSRVVLALSRERNTTNGEFSGYKNPLSLRLFELSVRCRRFDSAYVQKTVSPEKLDFRRENQAKPTDRA
jgi:hypothetical protein